jgi:peptidoglycan/xylan/chitin deacetylase (PgdA/CDA1 family)
MSRFARAAGLLPLGTTALLAATHAAPALTGIAPLRRAVWPGLSGKGWPDHVALTFDDGPDPESTPQFLDLLARRQVKATFFLLGQMLVGAPDLAKRMVSEGHEVAIHGWTHRNHLRVPPGQIYSEMLRTSDLIDQVTGNRPTYFRPPYGVMTSGDVSAGHRLGLTPVLWTTWGRDWEARATPERVLATLTPQLRGGGTVLLHDSDCTSAPGSWRNTLGALDGLIDLIEDAGNTVGPLREHGLAAR